VRVTLKDIAQRAGVSIKTASNVVNDRSAHYSQETFDRVMQAATELGYVPNLAARHLRMGKTGLLALVIPDIVNPYFSDLARHVILEAEALGYTVIIDITMDDPHKEQRVIHGDRSLAVDGIILDPRSMAEEIAAGNGQIPIVLIGEAVWDAPYDHVAIDNVAAAHAATRHLAELGRRRIAPIGYGMSPRGGFAVLRQQGYAAAMQEAGLAIDPAYLVVPPRGMHDWQRGYAVMQQLLALPAQPDAIFCFLDALAFGAMRAILDAGLRIPEDIAIVGIDNVPESRYANPPLSTIAPDKQELARLAVTLLVDRATGRRTQAAEIFYPAFTLLARTSTIGVAYEEQHA
jgi:DNA-binding LacI/PurR family transcriptional regulator